MKTLVLRQFRPSHTGSLHEQWLSLTQVGSVLDYQRKFIELSAPLPNVSEDIALGQFINGLKNDIRAEVRVFGPRSLDHAMALALNVEETIRTIPIRKNETRAYSSPYGFGSTTTKVSTTPVTTTNSSRFSPFSPSPSSPWPSSPSTTRTNNQTPSSGSTASSKVTGEVRRLSDKELQQKREGAMFSLR